MRLRLDIAYDGTEFHGWASQPGLRTIQEELEAWLPRLLRLTEPVTLTCAGRTDAGVHARGQVAHVDLPEVTDVERVIAELGYKLRNVLPPDVVVRRVSLAPPGFDARFSAIWRRYVYRIADSTPDPLLRIHTHAMRTELDLARINAVACLLLAGTVRDLRSGALFAEPNQPIRLCVSAPHGDVEIDL